MILMGSAVAVPGHSQGFEPLLLVPIGFGGILANIPGAGLAYSAVENAVYAGDPVLLGEMARQLGVALTDNDKELLAAYYAADAVHLAVQQLAPGRRFQQRHAL